MTKCQPFKVSLRPKEPNTESSTGDGKTQGAFNVTAKDDDDVEYVESY